MQKKYYLKDTVTKEDLEAVANNDSHVFIYDEYGEFCVFYKNYPFDSDFDLFIDFEDYGDGSDNVRLITYNNHPDIGTVKYEDIRFLVNAGFIEGCNNIVDADIYKEVKHGCK